MSKKSTILIVDDQEVMRDTIALLLGQDIYDLEFAENGHDALTKSVEVNPDIILLDIMMPGMDGFEVCRRLRAHHRLATIPIVMVTALNDRQSWVTGIEAGADDFVFKPFDTVELRTRVRNIAQLNRYRRLVVEQTKFDWVIEQADEGYVMLDVRDQVVYANPQARLFLELPLRNNDQLAASFVSMARNHFHLEPKEAWQDWPNGVRDDPQESEVVRYLVRPETRYAKAFWLHVETLNLPPGSDVAHLIRLRDVSEQMSLQQDIWRFQHMVSHKMRTPLAVMLNSLELLNHRAEEMADAKLKEASHRAITGAERLRDEVNDILQYMHTPSLAAPGEGYQVADLTTLLPRVAHEIGIKQLQMAGIDTFDQETVPLTSRSVELIVWEILENAFKFHPGKTPLVQIFVSQLKSGEIGFWFGDNGQTLSPEQLTHAWVPYYQGEKSFTGEVAGMGLGLAMVASHVWQVGGRCRIYNRQGEPGVVVELILPVNET